MGRCQNQCFAKEAVCNFLGKAILFDLTLYFFQKNAFKKPLRPKRAQRRFNKSSKIQIKVQERSEKYSHRLHPRHHQLTKRSKPEPETYIFFRSFAYF